MPDTCLEDFDYLAQTLREIHPAYAEDARPLEEAAAVLKQQWLGREDIRITLGRLAALPGDGHTNLEIPCRPDTPCLPAPVRWFGGKLHILRDCGPLRQGDRLTAVCGLPLSAYLERLKSWLSHENAHLLLGRTTCYPQENHFLFSLLNLQAVFGSLAAYELEGERQGERFTVRLSPEPFAALLDAFDNPGFTGGSYIHTRIASDSALFCLDANRDGPEYQQTLDDFFRAVTQRGIRRITLDLSRNLGGSDGVIGAFIRYLAVDAYRTYGMERRRPGGGMETIRFRGEPERLSHPEGLPLYDGALFCAVSPLTFSSARTFAVTLRDNQLAKIIGGPTGGRPSSFGLPRRFVTPRLQIPFRVSTSRFLRPDAGKDGEDTLLPDDLLPESWEDFRADDRFHAYRM